MDGGEHDLRFHSADVREAVFQHPLFRRHLRALVQVLVGAAAAGAEPAATRGHAKRAGPEYLAGLCLLETGFLAVAAVAHEFAGQGALDEEGLALEVADTTAFVVQGFDEERF